MRPRSVQMGGPLVNDPSVMRSSVTLQPDTTPSPNPSLATNGSGLSGKLCPSISPTVDDDGFTMVRRQKARGGK